MIHLLIGVKRRASMVFMTVLVGALLIIVPAVTRTLPSQKAGAVPLYFALECKTNYKLLGIIPTWYEYFGTDYGEISPDGSQPSDTSSTTNSFIPSTCGIKGGKVQDHAVQIGLAVIDILLRIGALAAVAFVIMGGLRYMQSQGEPKNLEGAMATIINAAIGLGITVTAAAIVAFIGHSLGP